MNILSKNYELSELIFLIGGEPYVCDGRLADNRYSKCETMEKYREKAENEFCNVVDCCVITDLYVIDYHNDNSVEPNNKLPWQALANIAKLPNQWN